MTNRKFSFWKNLTILILGGAGLSTWMIGACDSVDADGTQVAQRALRHGPRASLEVVHQIPAGYVITPGGLLIHNECLHELPDGAVAHRDLSVTLNGKKIAQHSPCTHKGYRFADSSDVIVPGTGSGWVEASWAETTSTMFNHMDVGYWLVPANPVNNGQTIFLFPSLQNADSILQPVLQWGSNGSFGGAYWVYANWWAINTGSGYSVGFVSTPKTANVGDQMWGSLDLTNQSGANQYWTVIASDITTGQSITSSIDVTELSPFDAAQAGVLEAWNVSSCDSFPSGSLGQTYFPQPNLYQGIAYYDRNIAHPTWQALDYNFWSWAGPVCGFNISVGTTGNTWMNY